MSNILKFSIDNIEQMDSIEKSLFRRMKIKAFASGENKHTLPVDEDVIRRGAKTIYNKPILWKYNKYFDDAMGHEKDEVPCGFVPESEDNPIRFEYHDGKLYIVIMALIWTKYCGRLIEIFERDDNTKDVSVEIAVIEDEDVISDKPKVQDFVIAGITLLGEIINPACKGCEAELLEFSENKERYLNEMNFEDNSIPIDNTKESAVNGEWSNPRRKLFGPISKASNRKALLKEAYLIGDYDSNEPEITKFKYPHHVIRDGKLVIHERGLEAAFQRASQQGIVQGNVKSHLLRHYRELGLSQENFTEFGICKEDFELYFADNIDNSKERAGDSSMNKNIEEKNPKDKEEKMCDAVLVKEDDDDDVDDRYENDDIHDDEDRDECKEVEKDEKEIVAKMAILEDTIKKLQEENKAYMSKMEEMSDYENLKKFKIETEEKMAREKEMLDMKKVMSDIKERGIQVSEKDEKELMGKIKEFSSVEAWSNFVKAQAFDRVENIDGIVKIGLTYNTTKGNTGSIWDEI